MAEPESGADEDAPVDATGARPIEVPDPEEYRDPRYPAGTMADERERWRYAAPAPDGDDAPGGDPRTGDG